MRNISKENQWQKNGYQIKDLNKFQENNEIIQNKTSTINLECKEDNNYNNILFDSYKSN